MNISKIITIVIVIMLIQLVLIFYAVRSKQHKEDMLDSKKGLFDLEPINLGEIIVSLPTIREGEEITARVKIVVYLKKLEEEKIKEFESKYKPKLRQIAAKIIKSRPYIKLRNEIEEEESIKILMRNMMNKEIGMDIVKEVVFDGALIFE